MIFPGRRFHLGGNFVTFDILDSAFRCLFSTGEISEHSVDDREAVLIFLWVVDNRLDNLALGPRHQDCSSRLMDVRQAIADVVDVNPGELVQLVRLVLCSQRA